MSNSKGKFRRCYVGLLGTGVTTAACGSLGRGISFGIAVNLSIIHHLSFAICRFRTQTNLMVQEREENVRVCHAKRRNRYCSVSPVTF